MAGGNDAISPKAVDLRVWSGHCRHDNWCTGYWGLRADPRHPAGDAWVPIAAGGGVDIIGRQFAAKLSEQLNQPWVVENRTGAGGAIGIDTVAKAEPDGHTMLLMETSSVLHKWLHRDVPFDVVADFAPVAQIATTPIFLFAGPASPVSDLKSLIAYAKANPGKLTVGTPGVGTPHHLAALMFNVMAGVEITHVPYKGTAPALSDLLGGQIPLIWSTPNSLMQYVETGKIKPLAVASPSRIDILPDVPTVSESGYPNFDVTVWYGVSGPAKMPADVVARYGSAIAAVDKMPDVEKKLSRSVTTCDISTTSNLPIQSPETTRATAN